MDILRDLNEEQKAPVLDTEGAVLVLAADLCGQYAFPARYPVGVITGILGAPYLLFLLLRMNKKGGN